MIAPRIVRVLVALLATTPFAAAIAAPLPSLVADARSRTLGDAASTDTVAFRVALRARDQAGMDAAFAARRPLTASAIDAYLPDAGRYAAVAAWLRIAGFSVQTSPTRLSVGATGSASLAARVLATHFSRIVSEGHAYTAADREPTIPAALRDVVLGINGLQPQLHATPTLTMRKLATGGGRFNKQPGQPPFYPSDFLTAYQATGVGAAGAGTTTAIIIDAFPLASDLTTFWQQTGVNQTLANITFISTVAAPIPPPEGEESLDTEQASSLAPAGKVRVYASATLGFARTDQSYEAVIADELRGYAITQMNMSFAGCEEFITPAERATEDQYFQIIGLLGASVFASSGDAGADACQLRPGTRPFQGYPASSRFVAAAGGTSLTLNADSTIADETGWSGSGGGVSGIIAKPSWQAALPYPRRALPDFAADADPNTGAFGVYEGDFYQIGGTSLSAPIWSGLTGLINGARLGAGEKPAGPLPPQTTGLVGTGNFNDITQGNNGKPAHQGFDLVTGVGSPNIAELAATLTTK